MGKKWACMLLPLLQLNVSFVRHVYDIVAAEGAAEGAAIKRCFAEIGNEPAIHCTDSGIMLLTETSFSE